MKKRILSMLLVIVMVLGMLPVIASADEVAQTATQQLSFNSDGKFKIVVFADCQDDATPVQSMIELIENALDRENPDLVVFTGDNVSESTVENFRIGASKIIQPLIERNIPYAYTFGNHDDEYGVSKEQMHEVYQSLGNCLTYDADPTISGFGNCNLPIYSSDGSNIAFNLWIMDSLTYDGNGGYNYVQADQLAWYQNTSAALEQQVGHKVNSIMFQHIALPEIYNLLVEDANGSHTYNGKKYSLALNDSASGYLGEFPCPPTTNGGQFAALKERGDVLGVVTGHDHANCFEGTYDGIRFTQMPGMSIATYGDDAVRGYGIIELDESNTSTYTTSNKTYADFTAATPKITKVSMTLNGILDVNFKVASNGADMSKSSIQITGAVQQTISNPIREGDLYVYTAKVPAHKLPENLTVKLLYYLW